MFLLDLHILLVVDFIVELLHFVSTFSQLFFECHVMICKCFDFASESFHFRIFEYHLLIQTINLPLLISFNIFELLNDSIVDSHFVLSFIASFDFGFYLEALLIELSKRLHQLLILLHQFILGFVEDLVVGEDAVVLVLHFVELFLNLALLEFISDILFNLRLV